MSIVEWKPEYLLGIEQIDEHHRHLFNLLNKTYDSFVIGNSKQDLSDLFDELIDYATYHFAAEEVSMCNNDYSLCEAHRALHTVFSKRVLEIQNDYVAGKGELSLEILTFLKNWITDHILIEDAKYGHYVSSLN